MRTKAFHAFEQKMIYFEDDIELIDVLIRSVAAGDLTDRSSTYVLKHIDTTAHKHLSRRQNSDGSRELIINHLRSTLYSSYIKDIYEEVTHYLKTILEKSAENGLDSGRIIGEHSFKIDAKDVLRTGNWENVSQLIADSVFQNLESERSTLKLLEKIAKKLALEIHQSLIDDALPYLEVRHLLVHSDGKASNDFKHKYPRIKLSKGFVILNDKFIRNMRDSVRKLITAYDKEVIRLNLLKDLDTQP